MSWASREWLESVDDFVREHTLHFLEVLREEQGDTFMDVLEIVSRYDPEGLLEIGAPPSEYVPEVRTIYPRLSEARSIEAVRRIIEEEFRRAFGTEHGAPEGVQPNESYQTANPDANLDMMATDIWRAWKKGQ